MGSSRQNIFELNLNEIVKYTVEEIRPIIIFIQRITGSFKCHKNAISLVLMGDLANRMNFKEKDHNPKAIK